MARKVLVLFVRGARKESDADCQWCGLSSTLPTLPGAVGLRCAAMAAGQEHYRARVMPWYADAPSPGCHMPATATYSHPLGPGGGAGVVGDGQGVRGGVCGVGGDVG